MRGYQQNRRCGKDETDNHRLEHDQAPPLVEWHQCESHHPKQFDKNTGNNPKGGANMLTPLQSTEGQQEKPGNQGIRLLVLKGNQHFRP